MKESLSATERSWILTKSPSVYDWFIIKLLIRLRDEYTIIKGVFLNGPIQASFLFIFAFSIQLTVNVKYKFCQWLDSNRGLLEMEATALPTKPQPLKMSLVSLRNEHLPLSHIYYCIAILKHESKDLFLSDIRLKVWILKVQDRVCT